jgi:hypothetical protein
VEDERVGSVDERQPAQAVKSPRTTTPASHFIGSLLAPSRTIRCMRRWAPPGPPRPLLYVPLLVRQAGSREHPRRADQHFRGCHGLGAWCLTLVATKGAAVLPGMPRAWRVVPHAGGYQRGLPFFPGCHGLGRWCLTLAATKGAVLRSGMPRAWPVVPHAGRYQRGRPPFRDATGLARGIQTRTTAPPTSRHRDAPRAMPVASTGNRRRHPLATSVRHHGPSP